MRAILIFVATLSMCGPILAQQRKQATTVPRTFVPNEPQPCIEFNQMAARLDAVYKTDEISKIDYDEGMKKYREGTQEEGVDYFIGGKDKYQRISLQRGKLAEFIRWYVLEGGRGQMSIANTHCTIELGEREGTYEELGESEGTYERIYALRQLQDATTVSEAEGLLADVALEGQNVMIKALLESESARSKVVDRYNKLVENVNTYNKAVNDLVVTVNTAMSEPKGSKLAPTLSFNFVRLQPITCTASTFAFSNSTAYMANVHTMASATLTMQCDEAPKWPSPGTSRASLADSGNGIALDSFGNADVTGETLSTNFPTTPGTFQATAPTKTDAFCGTAFVSRDAFVTKLNTVGSALAYSTYLGGDRCDVGQGIALDSAGNAYVTGVTSGFGDFPTTSGAYQTTPGGRHDAFVAKISNIACKPENDDVEGNGHENGNDGHEGEFRFCKSSGEMDFEERDSRKGMKGRMNAVTISGNEAIISGAGNLLDGTPVNYTAVVSGNQPVIGANQFAISWITTTGSVFQTSGALTDGHIVVNPQ